MNIPDTVGYALPESVRSIIETLYERVPELEEGSSLSAHGVEIASGGDEQGQKAREILLAHAAIGAQQHVVVDI